MRERLERSRGNVCRPRKQVEHPTPGTTAPPGPVSQGYQAFPPRLFQTGFCGTLSRFFSVQNEGSKERTGAVRVKSKEDPRF